MTTRDVAMELLVTRALDQSDQKLVKLMSKRVGTALQVQKQAGRVRSLTGAGMWNLWEIVRGANGQPVPELEEVSPYQHMEAVRTGRPRTTG